jgi:hypothetical protein
LYKNSSSCIAKKKQKTKKSEESPTNIQSENIKHESCWFATDVFLDHMWGTMCSDYRIIIIRNMLISSLFGWLVADGWCWFVLRDEYCCLVAGGWFVLREKYLVI